MAPRCGTRGRRQSGHRRAARNPRGARYGPDRRSRCSTSCRLRYLYSCTCIAEPETARGGSVTAHDGSRSALGGRRARHGRSSGRAGACGRRGYRGAPRSDLLLQLRRFLQVQSCLRRAGILRLRHGAQNQLNPIRTENKRGVPDAAFSLSR